MSVCLRQTETIIKLRAELRAAHAETEKAKESSRMTRNFSKSALRRCQAELAKARQVEP